MWERIISPYSNEWSVKFIVLFEGKDASYSGAIECLSFQPAKINDFEIECQLDVVESTELSRWIFYQSSGDVTFCYFLETFLRVGWSCDVYILYPCTWAASVSHPKNITIACKNYNAGSERRSSDDNGDSRPFLIQRSSLSQDISIQRRLIPYTQLSQVHSSF